ncbi:MAG: YtxH domain-containing protein [Bryobacteraceae bacterium]|jgi:gas vesicle protein
MSRDGLANFFLGLGIGVGVGLLFAPKSGEETRDILLSKADEGKEYLKKQTSGLRESASEMVDKGREVINRQKDTLSEAIEAGKQAYREKVEPNGASQAV